jgi:hypothetical protein
LGFSPVPRISHVDKSWTSLFLFKKLVSTKTIFGIGPIGNKLLG